MAERRMFAKTIIDSDAFLDMPVTARLLYYDLSMRADDDGFINSPKKIQRMIGASDDDLKVLITKRFLIPFESGVVVIKHWKIHNYIQKDRYKPTVYQEEKALLCEKENNVYSLDTNCIQNVYSLDTQDRLGKDRIGKDRLELGEGSIGEDKPLVKINFDDYANIYNNYCFNLPSVKTITEKRKTAIRKFNKEFNIEDFKDICIKANESDFLIGNNDRGWKADFDFILRIDKATSILEGKYNNIGKKTEGNRLIEMIEGGVFDE